MLELSWVGYLHCSKKYNKVVKSVSLFSFAKVWAKGAFSRVGSIFLLLCLLVFCQTGTAKATTIEQLELAYLYKFLSFVTLADTMSPEINVVILGSEKFGADLHVLANKTLGERVIVIKPYATLEDLKLCQVVFITDQSSADIAEVLKIAEDRHCLTVSDVDDFVDQGGMIGFVLRRGRLRFEINQKVTLANGIRVNSNLLEVASKVIR